MPALLSGTWRSSQGNTNSRWVLDVILGHYQGSLCLNHRKRRKEVKRRPHIQSEQSHPLGKGLYLPPNSPSEMSSQMPRDPPTS